MDLNKLYKEIEEAEVSLNAKRLKYIKEALAENNGIIKLKFKEFKETNDAFDFDDQFPVMCEELRFRGDAACFAWRKATVDEIIEHFNNIFYENTRRICT